MNHAGKQNHALYNSARDIISVAFYLWKLNWPTRVASFDMNLFLSSSISGRRTSAYIHQIKKKKIHENRGWVSRGFISQCPKSTFATAMNEQDNLWKYEKLSQWDLSWEKLFDFFTPTFCIRKTFLRATNKIYLCDGGQNCLRNWKKMDLSPRWSFKLKSISESIDFKFYPSEWIFYWMLSDESLYLNKYIK